MHTRASRSLGVELEGRDRIPRAEALVGRLGGTGTEGGDGWLRALSRAAANDVTRWGCSEEVPSVENPENE
jgi:hypothetical protein